MENTPTEDSVPTSSVSPNCWFPRFSSIRHPRFKLSKVQGSFCFLFVSRSLWLKAIVWTGHFRVFPRNGEFHIPETKKSWTRNKCKFLCPHNPWLTLFPSGNNNLILLGGQPAAGQERSVPNFLSFPMENPHFSLKTSAQTEFVALVELNLLLKITPNLDLQPAPESNRNPCAGEWRQPWWFWVWKRSPFTSTGTLGKIQQGEGWVWTPSRFGSSLQPQSWNPADSTEAFCASSAAAQINAIKDLLFHGLGSHWGRFFGQKWNLFWCLQISPFTLQVLWLSRGFPSYGSHCRLLKENYFWARRWHVRRKFLILKFI